MKRNIFLTSVLALFLGTFSLSGSVAHAAANIGISLAVVYTPNSVLVKLTNPSGNIASVDFTKWHIDQNNGGSSPLTPTGWTVANNNNPGQFFLTFAGTPFAATDTAYDAAHGLYVDAAGVTDTEGDTNAVVLHSSSVAITDSQVPAITPLTIVSGGADPLYAKVGDTVTVTFTASEALGLAVVNISSNAADTLINTSGNTWEATRVMQSGDASGVIEFEVYAEDPLGNASNDSDYIRDTTDASSVTFDEDAPTLSETTPVPTPSAATAPSYAFTSDEAGDITYGGDCSSATTAASSGANTVTFDTLAIGTHSNCTITVTDAADNDSNILAVTAFEITAPATPTPAPAPSHSSGGGYNPILSDRPGYTAGQVITPTAPVVSPVCTPYLSSFLKMGDSNADVSKLQTFLKTQGFFTFPTITGFFGPVTFQAVKEFQLKYAADILASQGLAAPTGFVGVMTVREVNGIRCR